MIDRFNIFVDSVRTKKVNFLKFNHVDDFKKDYIFNQNYFNVIHINVRSIRKHWLSLLAYLNDFIKFLDVIVLTEVKVKEENILVFQLDCFDLYSRCRSDGRGGGIAAFVRNSYVVDRKFFDLDQCEHLCLKLKHNACPFEIILSCIYRPPDKNVKTFLEQLDLFLNNSGIKNQKIVMVGDINIDTMSSGKEKDSYLNVLLSNGLLNTILDFTREEIVDGELKKSCVDHVNIRVSNCNKYDTILIKNKVADHYFVGCSISLQNDTSSLSQLKNTKCSQKIISNKKVKIEIEKTDWSSLQDLSDPEELYDNIKKKFDIIYENSIVEIESNELDKIKPWVNWKIKGLIKQKESLFNSWKKDRKKSKFEKGISFNKK